MRRLIGLFAGDYVIDEDAVQDAIARRSMFNVIHAAWIVKADVIVRKDAAYRKVELDRRGWLDSQARVGRGLALGAAA